MKKWFMNNNIKISIVFTISLIIFDYINLPSLLGFDMHNINWEYCMAMLNVTVVIMIYVMTYKTLNERTIEREKNKNEISILLTKQCYEECIRYVELLNRETVEKYIVPKIDFDSTNNKIISNLKDSPFANENIIMDLVKDGQITKKRIEKYFEIKGLFSQYIITRIVLFDNLNLYEPIKRQLLSNINQELDNINNLIIN